ncbi:hypothetical protein ZWY2020_018295 [Hordeum vulgare]|nr:hypothetical protein ZWY2020_018295 [Hordeum vulgare]
MAGLPRFVGPLVVLLLLVSPAQPTPYSDNLQDACNKTLFPKVCIQSLTTNPETRTADARRLAELSVYVAKEVGTTVAAFAHHELNGIKDDNLFKCLDGCSDDTEETVAHLSALTREPTNAKFLEVKSWLSATLGGSSTCEESCKDAPISDVKNAVVTKSLEFEKLLRVTLDLITEASGSMSGDVAMPPTAWDASAPGAYGASAPESSESASAPGSSGSSAPESSDSASAPGSSGSSASDSSDSASAPGSSGSSAPESSDSASAPGSSAPESSDSASAPGSSGSSAPDADAPSSDAPAPSKASTSEGPSADAPSPSYGAASGPTANAPSSSSDAPTSDAPSADAPAPSYGAASGPTANAPSSSSSDADAPSSGAADAPSYGSAGAPSPSGAGAPDADSTE